MRDSREQLREKQRRKPGTGCIRLESFSKTGFLLSMFVNDPFNLFRLIKRLFEPF